MCSSDLALVVLFSPLLDQRSLGAITDLRQRGFPVVVVDVLRAEPPGPARSRMSDLALRIWRLDRDTQRFGLESAGIPVISWPAGEELDAVMAPVRRVPAMAARR